MDEFKIFMQKKGLAIKSQEFYCYQVERFLRWYEQDPLNAQTKDVLKYLDYLQNVRGVQNATRRHHLTSINHYFHFIGRGTETAFIDLQATKKRRLSHVFTPEELAQLYDDYYTICVKNIDPNNWRISLLTRWRNYVMLGCLVFQGIHTHELDTLTVGDLDLNKGKIKITPKGSTGNPRTLTLEPTQIGGMIYYLQNIRPQLASNYNEPTDKLFLPDGRFMLEQDKEKQSIGPSLRLLNNSLKELNKDFRKALQLRTSFITNCIKTYGLRKTQVMAGHRSIVSTEEYVHNDLDSLVNDINKFNPFSLL